jgi:hypothetical protein
MFEKILEWYYGEDETKITAKRISLEKETTKPTLSVVKYNGHLSKAMTEGCLQRNPLADTPDISGGKKVWIYNVSLMSFSISSHPIFGDINIPAREEGKQYSVWSSIPSALRVPRLNVDSSTIEFFYQDGRRIAMDIINPDNLGLDQTSERTIRTGVNRNLGDKGVFWSLNNPPTKQEILAAKKRMRGLYKMLLEQVGTQLFTSAMSYKERIAALVKESRATEWGKKRSLKEHKENAEFRLKATLGITPEHHAAAEFFGMATEWHPVLDSKKKRKTQEKQ